VHLHAIVTNSKTAKEKPLLSGEWTYYWSKRGADNSLARPERIQATATEDFIFICPTYNNNWRNIVTIYICNKTSIKRNIQTFKQNTSGSSVG